MRVLGLDIGSRSVDAVWLEDGLVVDSAVVESGFDPQAAAAALVDRWAADVLVATGYGRHSAREAFSARTITEIKAYALGATALFPGAASVLDIGGQDTKVIALGPSGAISDFEMNDKCSAGTGRFLEVMAGALGFGLDELGEAALNGESGIRVSSTCTVFAESEVIGLVHRGEDRGRISLGIHESIAQRALASLARIGARPTLVFAGGVARNPALVRLVSEQFEGGGPVVVPDDPQTVGAYGAALYGMSLVRSARRDGPAGWRDGVPAEGHAAIEAQQEPPGPPQVGS